MAFAQIAMIDGLGALAAQVNQFKYSLLGLFFREGSETQPSDC